MIGEVSGHVPTFGYPMINYSPKQCSKTFTDATVWKQAIISDCANIKDLSESDYVMKTTAQLKLELTSKQEKAEQKLKEIIEAKKMNRMQGLDKNLQVSQQYPIGVKCHIYKELHEEYQKNHSNQWKNIYALLGVQAGQN